MSGAKAIVITDNNIYDDTAYIHMIDDESEMSANIPAGFLVGKSGLVFFHFLLKFAMINNINFQ